MVLRAVTVNYTIKNTGNVTWTFYIWVYIYNETTLTKINFDTTSFVSPIPGQSTSKTISKTVDLTPGYWYNAVVAVYKDIGKTVKLADWNSYDCDGSHIYMTY